MKDIVIKSEILVVKEIKKKTSAMMFKDLKVGDEIVLSVAIKYAGHNRGQTYSTYIKALNMATGESSSNSFNQLPKLLEKFIFEGYTN